MGKQTYLRSSDVLKELKNKNVYLSKATLISWLKKGLIPSEYYIVEIHGNQFWYRFKKEVVDYIINNIIKVTLQKAVQKNFLKRSL
ncbi:MAG TPA: hypothetical protein EYG91_05100 [Aquifex aeolicus]|nr:hypothetical protein [Aquifex aeolicus]